MNLLTFNNLRRSCDAGEDLIEFPAIVYDDELLETITFDRPYDEVHMNDICSKRLYAVAFYDSSNYKIPFVRFFFTNLK